MSKTSHLFWAGGALLLLASQARGEANIVAPFLQNGMGGRASALADCYTAVAEGPFGHWFNPAVLGASPGIEVGFQSEALGMDMIHNSLASSFPLGNGGFGILINAVNYGNLDRLDENGQAQGASISPADSLFSAGYGFALNKNYAVGANLGIYTTDLGTVKWSGVIADLAGLWSINDQWTAGAVLKNLGTGHDGFSVPATLCLGGAFREFEKKQLLVNAELDIPLVASPMEIGLAAEYRFFSWLDARLGYKSALGAQAGQDGLNFGLGFNLGSFGFDLSFMSRGDYGFRNSATLTYAFNHAYHPLADTAGPGAAASLQPEKPEKKSQQSAKAGSEDRHVTENANSQAEYHFRAGQEYDKYRRTIDAIIEYKAALKLRPDYPEAQRALLNATQKAQEEMKQEEKTLATSGGDNSTLQKSIRKHYELGLEAYHNREYNTAIKELQLVLELTSKHQEATELLRKAEGALKSELANLRLQAEASQQKGDLVGEINAYQKILDLDPNNSAAVAQLRTARRSIPKQIDQLYKRGLDQYAKGQLRESLKTFENLLKLQPDHLKAKDAIATIKEKLIRTGQ